MKILHSLLIILSFLIFNQKISTMDFETPDFDYKSFIYGDCSGFDFKSLKENESRTLQEIEKQKNKGENLDKDLTTSTKVLKKITKEYPCTHNKCEKSFKSKSGLRNHIGSKHLGITFECPICKNNFVSMGNRGTHIKTKHKEMLLKCRYGKCKKFYTNKLMLEDHINLIHKSNNYDDLG